ncbi:DNA-binding protein [Bacillus multifaciens]|uniref:DNA-binding protein n=1 Tax=Bacillus multifaciens TaxID=3068506 RepID=UPI00274036FE|nr:DNA-binding protein [Bacillus sp. WLY-B-L8]MDP7980832.1 DNA-binding protein [Bacillus sp. WLY-B-L8]
MYKFDTKDDLIRFINEETVNTTEAVSILGCSRQYIHQLVTEKKLIPIKEMPRDRLFFKEDILKRKEQMRK